MDWKDILTLSGILSGLVWLIIRLITDPIKEDIREIRSILGPATKEIKSESDLKRMIKVEVTDRIAEHADKCQRRRSAPFKPGPVALAIAIAILLAILCMTGGCAHHGFSEDFSEGDSYGIFRNHEGEKMAIVEEYDAAGNLVKRTTTTTRVCTKSTTADVLMGGGDLISSLIDGYNKVKP